MKPVTVYTLHSTRDGLVRYVGQTVGDMRARLRQHRSYAKLRKQTAVHKWIARELAEGFEIEITAIAEDAQLHVTEIAMIAKYRVDGHGLLNHTDGGEGTVGWRGNAGKKRPDIAMRLKGTKSPALAERNRARAGKPGHPSTPETNAKISAAHRGRKAPWVAERNRAKAGHTGHAHTAESREKIGAAHRGKVVSNEARKKISEKAKGRKLSPEGVAKMREGYRIYVEAKRNGAAA